MAQEAGPRPRGATLLQASDENVPVAKRERERENENILGSDSVD